MSGKLKFLKQNLGAYLKTLLLLWKTGPSSFIFIFTTDTLIGLIVPAKLWVWKEFVDAATEILAVPSTSIQKMLIWLAGHFVLTMLNSVLNHVSSFLQSIFSANLNKVLTEKIMHKTMVLDMKDFDNAETYNQIQKSSDQSLNRSISILTTTVNLINNITSFVGIITILVFLKTSIVLLCLLSAVPMFFISMRILNKWFDVFNQRFEHNRFVRHLKTIMITYDQIKELKISRADQYLTKTIVETLETYIQEDKKIRKRFLIETSLIDIVDNSIMYFIKILIVITCVKNSFSIGSLTMYVSAVDNLKNVISNLLSLLSTAYENCLYMQSIFQLLDIPEEAQEGKDDFPVPFETVEFRGVSFCYPGTDRYVLRNINVTLQADHSYALVGLNGSGKTTFIKLLLNLYQPTEGEILVDGKGIGSYNRSSLLKHVAAVFQDFIQYPFDIKTNIGLGDYDNELDLEQVIAAAKKSGADEFVSKLPDQYDTKLKKEWSGSIDLSLGQWQKVAIARALIKPSAILIMDEPTASLDVVSEHEIFEYFKDMRISKLCILVTHRFVNTRDVDNIIVLESGEIKEMGTHASLMMQRGVYAQLYQMQADSYEHMDFQNSPIEAMV